MRRFAPLLPLLLVAAPLAAQAAYSLEQLRGYPFPTELTAAARGNRIAWAMDERGQRNIYVAEGPGWSARRLTNYTRDDGQELTSVQLSADGRYVVYVRGGDHGSNWDDALPVNPAFDLQPTKVQVWSIAVDGGTPALLGDGDLPVTSPSGDRVAFERGGQLWTVSITGGTPARQLFTARGTQGEVEWSPDGRRLAFVSSRGGHSFIGVYTDGAGSVQWLAPSFARDRSPRWSPDGARLAFVRMPGQGGAPDSLLARRTTPWSIWTADVATGTARQAWASPRTERGSVPTTHGGTNLHWGAGRIVFLSYMNGWPQLYSIPEAGGEALHLTPGAFMAEHIRMSKDGKWVVFAANTGPDPLDTDRRHVVRVPVDRAAMQVMTPGAGNEWSPVVTGDGATLVHISATHARPPLVTAMPLAGGASRLLAADRIPADFPATRLVTPRQVVYKAPDGTPVHAQLFEPPSAGATRKPAVIYIHGGPPRQMLLGWHYSDYYSNAYAMNQYLASQGFVVLSVNYRLGIGYGFDFHVARGGGTAGASEYQDIRAAGEWLAAQPFVDPARIGVYGGSYGGYLTAMALARDSKLFAAGVDIHGVHDRSSRAMLNTAAYERAPDAERAFEVAWRSSPVADMATWTSPVLIIHGDDDRNVRFNQSTDLVRRLEAHGVPHETMVVVDDTHHFMRHANLTRVGAATVDFLRRKLRP